MASGILPAGGGHPERVPHNKGELPARLYYSPPLGEDGWGPFFIVPHPLSFINYWNNLCANIDR